MARGFDATYGAGTTDRISSTASVPDVASFHMWVVYNGSGGGTFGRPFDGSALATSGMYMFANVGAQYSFNCLYSGGIAAWITDTLPGSVWEPLGVRHDPSNVANEPVVFQSGVKKFVGSGLTLNSAAPSGAYVTAGGAIVVGNRSDGTRNWDGMIAEFAVWNVQLTDGEFAALARGFSPLLIRPTSLVEYIPMVRDNVSLKRAAPTITGTLVQPHPRIIQPRRWRSAARPAGPPPPVIPETLFAQACL